MRRRLLFAIGVAILCLVLAVPAYAYSGNANGGNGGVGNGMGSQTHGKKSGSSPQMRVQSIDTGVRSNVSRNHNVSVYGTSTGTQFLNGYGNRNAPGSTTMYGQSNANTFGTTNRMRTQSYTNDGYRALETTTSRDFNWSWLGLLGLLGLFGIRSRNPQRDR